MLQAGQQLPQEVTLRQVSGPLALCDSVLQKPAEASKCREGGQCHSLLVLSSAHVVGLPFLCLLLLKFFKLLIYFEFKHSLFLLEEI